MRFWLHVLCSEPWGYLVGGVTSGASAALSLLAAPHASLAHVMIIYLLGAVLISTRFGAAVSSFTVMTSTLCFDYFNIPPQFAFATPSVHDSVTLGGMLLTAILVSFLIQRLRYQRSLARSSEARTLALCELSLDLSQVAHVKHLPATAEAHLVKLFGLPSQVFLRDSDSGLAELRLPAAEHALALRALETQKPWAAPSSRGEVVFQPINSGSRTLGVIRSELSDGDVSPTGQEVLLAACADRVAVALERWTLASAARHAQVEIEAERLRSELLSAMSHDLKTPLACILTAGTTLLNRSASAEPDRHLLLHTIVEETERLNGLVTNLLTVTRLESGKVQLNKVPEALDDLIHGALSRFTSRLGQREVQVNVRGELPLISMDPVLIDQVLANLIENALRYTPDASPLEISVHTNAKEAVLEVADRGPGIADDERSKVFDKFYRGSRAKLKDGGSGLGLTICRAVARAHGGRIAIHPRLGGGTTVEFALPLSSSGKPRPLPLPAQEATHP
ncbi:MAG TPA: ATP-binding protein [Polyangiaceae bacterium]|nr:ATP-binding protein [Polyangiaceae bacterium]